MRDPLSRKLFTTRDAREHLRGMGGIMSSSPRLAETVAKFNLGGDVTVPIVGAPQEPVRATFAGSNFAVFPDGRVVNTDSGVEVDDLQDPGGDLRRAIQASVAGGPAVSEIPLAIDELPSVAAADTALEISGLPPEMTGEIVTRDPLAPRPRDRRQRLGLDSSPPPVEDEAPRPMGRAAVTARQAAAAQAAEVESAEAEAAAAAQAAAEAETAQETEQAAAAEQERQEAARRAQEELERSRAAGGTGGDFDLDTTFDQMLGRLERVMGTKDEDSRQKAMANLAMIGLAIAAGQSPDALTNIAQGALTGMQAIRREQASEEATQREMRLTALQMASAEVENRRKLQNALMVAGLRGADGSESTRQEYLYNDVFRKAYEAALLEGGDVVTATELARQAARQAAPNAPSAQQDAAGVGGSPGVVLTEAERRLLGLGS